LLLVRVVGAVPLDPENEDMILGNIGNYLPNDTASHPGRLEYSPFPSAFKNCKEFFRALQVLITLTTLPKSQEICVWILVVTLFNGIESNALVERREDEPP
jgi:hypothetical protein